jgi:hypothetical protein
MSKKIDCFVYAGPSLSQAVRQNELLRDGIAVLPPIARGEIARLVDRRAPAAIVIADGRFHQALPVGHVELRDAIERGWRIWGVSSIGAIRAYELRHMGMRGYGRVYRMFFRFRDFQDDEVAMLHDADPPYALASEPLVHMRFALNALVRKRVLTMNAALGVLAQLKGLWFGYRTRALFCSLVVSAADRQKRAIAEAMLAGFQRYCVKQQDLASLLAARPWSIVGHRRD